MSRRFQPKGQHGRIVKMSPVASNSMFTSLKNNSVIFLQTENEFFFCYFLEFDTRVRSYIAQPPKIKYHIDQECHEYTADFYVCTFSDGDWYFEIKGEYFDISDHSSQQEKYESIKYDLNKEGYNFKIIDNLFNKKIVVLDNMKQLLNYRRHNINEKHLDIFKTIMNVYNNEPIKLNTLIKNICQVTGYENEFISYQAYTLISKGILDFNVHERFSRNVFVRLSDEDKDNIWNEVPL